MWWETNDGVLSRNRRQSTAAAIALALVVSLAASTMPLHDNAANRSGRVASVIASLTRAIGAGGTAVAEETARAVGAATVTVVSFVADSAASARQRLDWSPRRPRNNKHGRRLVAAGAGATAFAFSAPASAMGSGDVDPGTTVLLDPAETSTVAGNGTNANTDGTGAAASFRPLRDVTLADGYAFVSTTGHLRKVDLASGAVTTVAGSTRTDCQHSTVPTSVGFGSSASSIATDGTFVYSACSSSGTIHLRRTEIATGATTALRTFGYEVTGMTLGADGYLYVLQGTSGRTVSKVDRVTGVATTFATLPSTATQTTDIASDAEALWVATRAADNTGLVLRVGLADAAVTTTYTGLDGLRGVASAGEYLYVTRGTGNMLLRITKAGGAMAVVAGTNVDGASADGVEYDAWFNSPEGLVSDGVVLYVADGLGFRLRKAFPGPGRPRVVPDAPNTTITLDPAEVTTLAGNGTSANTDGTGTAASFRQLRGIALTGAHAYLAADGAIRKVDRVSGEVTTLAGSTRTDCQNSATPTQVGFGSTSSRMATDGAYLYTSCSSGGTYLRRTSLATGATSSLLSLAYVPVAWTVGPDGYLYVLTGPSGLSIWRVDTRTGKATIFKTLSNVDLSSTLDVAVDAQALWVLGSNGGAGRVRRVALADAVESTVFAGSTDFAGIASAGAFLYITKRAPHAIARLTKTTGEFELVAGANANGGFADGVEFDAWFSSPGPLASDGTSLYVADGTFRLRKAVPGPARLRREANAPNATVALDPADVTTVAGSGAPGAIDGVGTAASLNTPRDLAVVDGVAYVSTVGRLRRIDLTTKAVTTLAGSSSTSCVDSAAPMSVGLGQGSASLATDGVYVYSTCSASWDERIRRTSVATGATSTVAGLSSRASSLTMGPDGFLYAVVGLSILRVDPASGVKTTFATFPSAEVSSIGDAVADANAVWLTVRLANGNGALKRVGLADAGVTTPFTALNDLVGIASAGAYVYVTRSTGHSLVRIAKGDGAYEVVAGGSSPGAFGDGTEHDAWFNTPDGLASDGNAVYVADSYNHRLRQAVPGQPRTTIVSNAPNLTIGFTENTGPVYTYAGNGAGTNVDGNALDASFSSMGGMTLIGRNLYVLTAGYLRRVDMATGDVTTLAGSSASGCNDSNVATSVRFLGTGVGRLTTDGAYIYSSCYASSFDYRIRRTSVATGATTQIFGAGSTGIMDMKIGPDGGLYVLAGTTIRRYDTRTLGWSTFATFSTSLSAQGMAVDDHALWVSGSMGGAATVLRVDLQSAAITTVVSDPALGSPFLAITSAGDYLYAMMPSPYRIVRIAKATGALTTVAGGQSNGYADGDGPVARFDWPSAVLADGSNVWVADSGNRRLRVLPTGELPKGPEGFYGNDEYAAWADDVNSGTGNFVTTALDGNLTTVGPDMKVERTYNSRETRAGPFGVGWSFNYGMSWKYAGDGVAVTYPDGRREFHTRTGDGTYKPPLGYFSTLTAVTGGFTLTQKDRTVYGFAADGKLMSITDAAGRRLDLAYGVDGRLATATDVASGRKLAFTWTGGYLTAVASDFVAAHGVAPTWRYYYTGNKLTQACDPGANAPSGSCITYTWTGDRITRITKPKGNVEVELQYLANGKVEWRRNGVGDTTRFSYVAQGTTEVLDPRNKKTIQQYDAEYRLFRETDPLGNVTLHTYDPAGNRNSTTDGNGRTSVTSYDGRGNPVFIRDPASKTRYMQYDGQDNLTVSRDARSAGPDDNTYATTYEYNGAGNRTRQTGPSTAEFPGGVERRWTFTTGLEAAPGGGVMPAGLVRTEVDERGKGTTHSYNSAGDRVETETSTGFRITWTYDVLGRRLTQTDHSDSFPGGVTTTWTYDVLDRVVTVTGPSTADPITGATSRVRTTMSYDANGNVEQRVVEDTALIGSARTTTYVFDNADRQASVTDPMGGVLSRTFDAAGNVVTVVDPEGRVTEATYDDRNLTTKVVLKDFVDDPIAGTAPRDVILAEYTYDNARRRVSEKDSGGRTRLTQYDAVDRLTKVTLDDFDNRDGSLVDIVLEERTYDADGRVLTEKTGHGKRSIEHTYDAAGRRIRTVLDGAGLNRVVETVRDEAGNTVREVRSAAGRSEEMRFEYDDGGRMVRQTVENGSEDLVSTFAYDQRGRRTRVTSARGNAAGATPADFTSDFAYDEIGRLTRTAAPPVDVESEGGAAVRLRPVTDTGWDVFGNAVRNRDPRGFVTTTEYDALDRPVLLRYPSYTRPLTGGSLQPTEAFVYDKLGNLLTRTDRRAATTSYTFDKRNRAVRRIDPPAAPGSTQGVARVAYDDAGNAVSVTDQRGAVVEMTYDDLDRPRTSTDVVRRPVGSPDRYTTTVDHDALGNRILVRDPLGFENRYEFNAASEMIKHTDPTNEERSFEYDGAGRLVRTVDPLLHVASTVYDLAGRPVERARYETPTATTPLARTTTTYDADGNVAARTGGRGYTTLFARDALGRLASVTEPVADGHDIVTTAGYDEAGNITRVTNGRGQSTFTTYNSWGLLEATTEPATAAHPAVADRTFHTEFDAGGLPVLDSLPGGIDVTRTFDGLGRLVSETGTDASSGTTVPSGSRNFGYDLAGLRTSISHPSSSIAVEYDDRRLPASVTGGSGSTTYEWDGARRLTRRADPAGVHTFEWTSRDELRHATDPLTGVAREYDWDEAGRLVSVRYGAGASVPQRTLAWDSLDQLVSDTLTTAAGIQQARHAYGYDNDGNVVSQSVDLPDVGGVPTNPAEGAHSYTYDRAGRLASWTDPGGVATAYGWDDAGNRTQAGAEAYVFDERNRLVSGPQGAYAWTARGTLASVTLGGVATTYAHDALGRTTARGAVSFAYDGLDRVANKDTTVFRYAGTDMDPVDDGAMLYSRGPAGDLLAVSEGGTALLAGANRHGDLAYLFDATGAVASSRIYEPFGKWAGTGGALQPAVGFQGDWTDPASGEVWMGARWYGPGAGGFLSRDTVAGSLETPATLNRHAYANGDPMGHFDPDGRSAARVAVDTGANAARAGVASAVYAQAAALGYRFASRDQSRDPRCWWCNPGESLEDWQALTAGMHARNDRDRLSREEFDARSAIAAQERAELEALLAPRPKPKKDSLFDKAKKIGQVVVQFMPGYDCVQFAKKGGIGNLGSCILDFTPAKIAKLATDANDARKVVEGFDAVNDARRARTTTGAAAAVRPAADAGRPVTRAAPPAPARAPPKAAAPKAKAQGTHEPAKVGTTAPNTAGRGADFVAGPIGSAPPVPVSQTRMAAGFDAAGFPRTPTASSGMEYLLPDGSLVRLMQPSGSAPLRASFTNAKGGPINPFTGKPVQPPAPSGWSMKDWVRELTHVEQTP